MPLHPISTMCGRNLLFATLVLLFNYKKITPVPRLFSFLLTQPAALSTQEKTTKGSLFRLENNLREKSVLFSFPFELPLVKTSFLLLTFSNHKKLKDSRIFFGRNALFFQPSLPRRSSPDFVFSHGFCYNWNSER